jgi:hypothetical protein
LTGPGFSVDAAELHKFAKSQRERQDALDALANKSAQVDLGGDTFGELLSFFATGAQQFAADATAAVRELSAALGNACEDTVATARTYESNEDINRDRFGAH